MILLRLEAEHPVVKGWLAQSDGPPDACSLVRAKSLSKREFNRLAARLPVVAGLKAQVVRDGVSFSLVAGQPALFTLTAEKVIVHSTYRRAVERTMRVLRQVRWAREVVAQGTEAFVKTVCAEAARFNFVVSSPF